MSANVTVRFSINVSGDPLPLAQPFLAPVVTLEEEPARYELIVAASGTSTLWSGAPLPTVVNFLVITSDQPGHITISPGSVAIPVPSGGVPLILGGGYPTATTITFTNENTSTAANVAVILGKAA